MLFYLHQIHCNRQCENARFQQHIGNIRLWLMTYEGLEGLPRFIEGDFSHSHLLLWLRCRGKIRNWIGQRAMRLFVLWLSVEWCGSSHAAKGHRKLKAASKCPDFTVLADSRTVQAAESCPNLYLIQSTKVLKWTFSRLPESHLGRQTSFDITDLITNDSELIINV